jgi:hypothetical protein
MSNSFHNPKPIAMNPTNLQNAFFARIKAQLPSYISMVDTVAEVLNMSTDSAYRRIRGEKQLTFEELALLSKKFNCPVDSLIGVESGDFVFSGKLANTHDHVFERWLEDVHRQFEQMRQRKCVMIYYLAKDLPVPHFILVPELAAFKFFFWQKSILQYEELKGEKFCFQYLQGESARLAEAIVHTYSQIPTCEVWNAETVNSTLRQIRFYRDAGMFQSTEDVMSLLHSMETLVDHLEKQAETGLKFSLGGRASAGAGEYLLFNNELILGNNTVFADYGGLQVTYLNHSVLNYIATLDVRFNEYMYAGILNMMRRSERLDRSNEKGRTRFFNQLRALIAQVIRESR